MYLITEDLNLARGPVNEVICSWADVVRVDLEVERQAFHPLLRGEVCAQRVDADVNLQMNHMIFGLGSLAHRTNSRQTGRLGFCFKGGDVVILLS